MDLSRPSSHQRAGERPGRYLQRRRQPESEEDPLDEDFEEAPGLWMSLVSVACSLVYWALLVTFWGAWEESYQRNVGTAVLDLRAMPETKKWDKRFYRLTETLGQEVYLLRRTGSRGIWIVAKPDESLGELDLLHRPTVSTAPVGGVNYLPSFALSLAKQRALEAQAEMVTAGQLAVVRLPKYGGPGERVYLRSFALLAAFPGSAAKFLRWSLRSHWRTGGAIALIFLGYDLIDRLGVFEGVRRSYAAARDFYRNLAETLSETYEGAASFISYLESGWTWFSEFEDPRRLMMWVVGLLLVLRAFGAETEGDYPSPSSSAAPSPPETPPASPRATEGEARTEEIQKKQLEILEALRVQHAELSSRLEADAERDQERRRAEVLLRGADGDRLREWRETDRSAIRALADRVEEFARAAGGRGGAASPAESFRRIGADGEPTSSQEATMELPALPPPPPPPPPAPPPTTTQPTTAKGAEEIIRKLERKAEQPQTVFLKALRDWKDIEVNEWAEHFPVGFRTRVAGEFLSEVYSGGTTGEKWARNFASMRGAARSPALKELTAAFIAIDTMILIDREPGVINRVSLEKLCRKAMGIVESWRHVECEADWSKPKDAPKAWKSKVNYDEARRVDPTMADEQLFRIRQLEDEVRGETEREANLLKARNKLEKQKAGES